MGPFYFHPRSMCLFCFLPTEDALTRSVGEIERARTRDFSSFTFSYSCLSHFTHFERGHPPIKNSGPFLGPFYSTRFLMCRLFAPFLLMMPMKKETGRTRTRVSLFLLALSNSQFMSERYKKARLRVRSIPPTFNAPFFAEDR